MRHEFEHSELCIFQAEPSAGTGLRNAAASPSSWRSRWSLLDSYDLWRNCMLNAFSRSHTAEVSGVEPRRDAVLFPEEEPVFVDQLQLS